MRRRHNGGHASGIATEGPDADSWRAFDGLPRSVRQAMWGAPVSISARSAIELLDYGGEWYAVRAIAEACTLELSAFAQQYRVRFGRELPHVGAKASVMSYEED